jgi:DNA invertase Pin-like site-specific DNA recombinase
MALIGYARVSTDDQTLDPQIDALRAAGCDRIFSEHASGADRDRAQLAAALDYMRAGDTIVVAKLDRLGRSLGHLLTLVEGFDQAGIGFRSLSEGIDTTNATGRLLLHVLGAVAQFERDLIIDRTRAGLAAARARGRVGGRPKVMTPDKLTAAFALIEKGANKKAAADVIGVSRTSLYRALRAGGTASG